MDGGEEGVEAAAAAAKVDEKEHDADKGGKQKSDGGDCEANGPLAVASVFPFGDPGLAPVAGKVNEEDELDEDKASRANKSGGL